jgi:protein-S-isoprenylcysteine O-methyltransferase Ste14
MGDDIDQPPTLGYGVPGRAVYGHAWQRTGIAGFAIAHLLVAASIALGALIALLVPDAFAWTGPGNWAMLRLAVIGLPGGALLLAMIVAALLLVWRRVDAPWPGW